MCVATHLASRPVATLKSAFSKEIFLLLPGFILFGFLGLDPKTIMEVLWEGDN